MDQAFPTSTEGTVDFGAVTWRPDVGQTVDQVQAATTSTSFSQTNDSQLIVYPVHQRRSFGIDFPGQPRLLVLSRSPEE